MHHPAEDVGHKSSAGGIACFPCSDGAVQPEFGGLAQHLLGHQADGVAILSYAVGPIFDGDDARFVQHDAFALDAHERIARAQVDAHVDAEHSQQRIEDHAERSLYSFPGDVRFATRGAA